LLLEARLHLSTTTILAERAPADLLAEPGGCKRVIAG